MWEAIAVGSVAFGVQYWKILQHHRKRLQGWQDAASSCGLQIVEISSPWAWRAGLAAYKGPFQVRIGVRHGKEWPTWIVVTGSKGFYGVTIQREHREPGPREIEVGDERFDLTFKVEGPIQLVGLLDAETRRLLLRLNTVNPLQIAGGELQLGVSDEGVPSLLPLLLDVAQRFNQHVDVVQRLAEIARYDPEVGVRLQSLNVLIRQFPKDPRTVEALRTGCMDASPQVRLRAARELGAEGRKVLMELAESTEDDGCSAAAVTMLSRDLEFERLRAILILAFRRRRIRTAVACLEVLGHSREPEAVTILAKAVAREKTELAAMAARALGWTGSPAAETPLILALERDDPDLQMSAATALGRVGSVAAVAPLKDAVRSSHNDEFRRAARQAVAEIQSRLPGASPGQLSLAGAEAGQLSLAQAEAGQLSLASDPSGQLSLSGDEDLK